MVILAVLLALLLITSVALNVYQAHIWNSYRGKPSGQHSYTGMFPAIKVK